MVRRVMKRNPRASFLAFAGILAVVTTATWAVWALLGFPVTGIDDANIFLAYAQNVSAGKGFVFNSGGEHVEGFTSLLWMAICVVAVTITDSPEWILASVNVLLVSLTIYRCLKSSILSNSRDRLIMSVPWGALFAVLLLSEFEFVSWVTVTLMETALWSYLLTVGVLAVADDEPRRLRELLIASPFIVVTRPESLLWIPVLISILYIGSAASDGHKSALRRVIAPLCVFIVAGGALTAFRLVYFGYPFPNTYYAKVSPVLSYRLSQGLAYLGAYLTSGPIMMACGVATLLSLAHLIRVRGADTRTLTLSVAAGAGLFVPVLTGGDHFDGFRFYQCIYPVLLLQLLNVIRTVLPSHIDLERVLPSMRRFAVPGAAALGGIAVAIWFVDWSTTGSSTRLRMEFEIAAAGRERGDQANEVFGTLERMPSIATITVGGLKYGYEGDVVDLMGLNDTRIAHNGGDRIGFRSHAAFDGAAFYELSPDVLIPLVHEAGSLSRLSRGDPFVDIVLKRLLDEPRFRIEYALAEIRRKTPQSGPSVAGWYRKGFLSDLRDRHEFHVRLQ